MTVRSARRRGPSSRRRRPGTRSEIRTTLILCFGNPLRGDEAVGWRVAEGLPAAEAGAGVVACRALVPEFAPAIAAAEVVIFVEACAGGTPGEVRCTRIHPARVPASLQHGETPASLLALANARYPAALLRI